MVANTLYPAYVEIDYIRLNLAPHTMTRPTRAWVGTPWADAGDYVAWDTSTIPAATMIDDFIDLLLPLCDADTSFTQWRIFTQATPTSEPVQVWAKNLTGIVGTSVATGAFKAVQRTYSLRASGGGHAKLVLLDQENNNSWDKLYDLGVSPDAAMIAALLDDGNAWAARDDTQLVAFDSLTVTLNEALRRSYRMS